MVPNKYKHHGNNTSQYILVEIVVLTSTTDNKLVITSANVVNIKSQQIVCVSLPSHTHNGNNICLKCGYKICHSHLDNNICQGIEQKTINNGITSAIK